MAKTQITNKAVAEILINAGVEKATYRNANAQLPQNAGFRLQTFKNTYHNLLTIYAAPTSWSNTAQTAELIAKISAALTAAGIAFDTRTDSVQITR